ncbi:hypothetical protein MLD38_029684 [Melastoma candidum]|uniref:Uncharacterized protein n=1 Tax=Melastoma candidum TaxID=119954 RepID=A0ACB9N4Q1_9MYRT|nr:hypothetical protein MLD38_029684 [Melastoma candidum]
MRSSSSSRPSPGRINIAASAQRVDVDNRISLRYYYRIADNVLRQADIFRLENNVIDLYIMLLRYSSLVSETIPHHREYGASPQSKKLLLRKKLIVTLTELEKLKPEVQRRLNDLNRKDSVQVYQNNATELPLARKQNFASYNKQLVARPVVPESMHQNPRIQQSLPWRPMDEQFRRMSLAIMRPNQETLSRHSILGPNGLHGQWQPPRSDKGVQYPNDIDLTPVTIPSCLPPPFDDKFAAREDSTDSEKRVSSVGSVLVADNVPKTPTTVSISDTLSELDNERKTPAPDEEPSMISFENAEETTVNSDIIRQPSPPPVLAEVQDLIPALSTQVTDPIAEPDKPSCETFVRTGAPLQLHISTKLMDSFMKMAKVNTDCNLETCGILAGTLKNRKFHVTTLIIPKQESTSDSCQATNEEEIFEVQDKRSLFPLGWIHTHPTQSCFMSSIDVHTHYSYQIMLPEAVAIVMAPRDSSRTHGIFRLTTPGGMSVIRHCQQRGFHSHMPPADGGPIYNACTDVYMNPDLKFDVIDLR